MIVFHPRFFDYCSWALDEYKYNSKVMHINGNNFGAPTNFYRSSIDFCSIPQVWGWASWSDRWSLFEPNAFYLRDQLSPHKWQIPLLAKLSKLRHVSLLMSGLDAWDYQWQVCILNKQGLVVSPRENLVSNVGVGSDATHTKIDNIKMSLDTGQFSPPNICCLPSANQKLTIFYAHRMGLKFHPKLLKWSLHKFIKYFLKFIKTLIASILFIGAPTFIVASTGRAGSTLLARSIGRSIVKARYGWLPASIQNFLSKFTVGFVSRLSNLNWFNAYPIVKNMTFYPITRIL